MRKKYFIKNFQSGLIIKFILLVLLESALIFGLFMYLSKDTITTGYSNSILTLNSSQNFFFTPLVAICLIVFICIGISGLIVFIFVSHRIAGPLYRFEKVLETLNQGDLTTKITLRKGDDCIELKNLLENFVRSLDRRMETIKNDVSELDHLLDQSDDPDINKKISEKITSLKNEINHFKITSNNQDG